MIKLSPEQVDQLVAWCEEGRSLLWIGRKLGISRSGVQYRCLAAGAVSPRQRGPIKAGPAVLVGRDGRTFRRFTEEEDAELMRLAAEGKRLGQIAVELGRPRTSVRMRMLLIGQREEMAA